MFEFKIHKADSSGCHVPAGEYAYVILLPNVITTTGNEAETINLHHSSSLP